MAGNLTPRQLAALDKDHAQADAELDAFIAEHRAAIANLGLHEASVALAAELDRAPHEAVAGIALLALTRLAQQDTP